MLNRKAALKPTREYAYLVSIELEDDVPPESMINKLSDAVIWVEGVGRTDIEFLGQLEEETDGE